MRSAEINYILLFFDKTKNNIYIEHPDWLFWLGTNMGLHQRIMSTPFKDRYLYLKEKVPQIKHLIHGGSENYYASPYHHTISERMSDDVIDKTLNNIELGLERVMHAELVHEELYLECHPREKQGERTREALWQYDLFADYKRAAVIGMNFHHENNAIVATVANVQGHDEEGLQNLRKLCYGTPWTIASLYLILSHLPDDIAVVRGVPSTRHPFKESKGFDKHRASNLYDRSFRTVGMKAVRDKTGSVQYYELQR